MNLDPDFVRLADQRLWRAHPELAGRALTGSPTDAALRAEWMRHYRDAASARPPPPAAVPTPATPPPAPGPVAQCAHCSSPTRRWLCVRSNVAEGAGVGLIDGHANLSLHEGTDRITATTTTYGLWPDDHPAVVNAALDNGGGSDVRVNFASDSSGYLYAHCRELSEEQYKKLQSVVARNHQWGYTNNCSSFASEAFYEVTGVDVDADDVLGIETPRELGESIRELNHGLPSNYTGPDVPAAPGAGGSSSSAGGGP